MVAAHMVRGGRRKRGPGGAPRPAAGARGAPRTGRHRACRPAARAGRARASGGYVHANGSGQDMGLYNVFVTHTLRESPAGHFVIAGSGCQAGSS